MTTAQLAMFGIEVIAQVARAVADAKDGTITPEQALAKIAEAGRQDASVDAVADAAIAKKFPAGTKASPRK